MKIDKNLYIKLEQLYTSGMNDLRDESNEEFPDVPNIQNYKDYKTNIPIPAAESIEEPILKTKKGKNILRELPEDDEIEDIDMYDKNGDEIDDWGEEFTTIDDEVVTEQEDENGLGELASNNINTGEQNTESGEDPNIDPNEMEPDPNSMMGGMGMNSNIDPLTGMEKKTAEQVGRIFELKKIYSRLLSINSQLSFSSDIILLKLRKFIGKSIELFETLISNIDTFKDDIDDIIIMYYDFLEEVYSILRKYYEQNKKNEENENKKNSKLYDFEKDVEV